MAAPDLADLVERLNASLNVPGEAGLFNFDDEDPWVSALVNAFWQARMLGFFPTYRVATDGTTVVNVTGTTDFPEQNLQIIVAYAAILAIEAKVLSLPTSKKAKAGPVEVETDRSAGVLRALLDGRRADLEQIRNWTLFGGGVTSVMMIDMVEQRACHVYDWLR